MDTCYISYIFSETIGYRLPFSKDMSVQVIGNCLRKYGGKKYIFLFRFEKGNDSPIVITTWIPDYYKIGDLVYPSWYHMIKTYPDDSILTTPRGDFKLKDVNIKFIEYCKKNYKIKKD